MSNYSVDDTRKVHDDSGHEIGKVDYDGQVRDGWRDKGKIENDRYVDEYGRDHGWVKKSSSSSGGGDLGWIIILLLLTVGIYYLMFLGIKWLVVEGRKSLAHASRSWGITSLLFPPVFLLALTKGYSAINEIRLNGGPTEQEKIAKLGLVFGYIGGILCVLLIIGLIMGVFNGQM